MKKLGLLLLSIAMLTGCRSTPFDAHSVIDWVDFIKWDGIQYQGIHSGVLADEADLGDKLGEVKFKVADNVTNPKYKIRNGDAAFHEKGTEIYAVDGYPNLIAVKSDQAINGYKVYFNPDIDYQWHFQNVPLDKVSQIEVYQSQWPENDKLIQKISDAKNIEDFLNLLKNSTPNSSFQPAANQGDPDYFDIILYTDEPVAYKYGMQYDGKTFFWHPSDTAILSGEMKNFVPVD